MKTRIITGIVAAGIFLPFLIWADELPFAILFSALALLGAYELLSCTQIKRQWAVSVPLTLFCGAMPLAVLLPGTREEMIGIITRCVLLFFLYLLCVVVLTKEQNRMALDSICIAFLFSLYQAAGFTAMVVLRIPQDGGNHHYLFWLPLIAAWVTDTFAYFTGRFFGKHKLCPTISPKKTVEGALGGILFCTLAVIGFGFWVSESAGNDFKWEILIPAGILLSVISQIGDLILSVIKRRFGVKDYGKLLPGHGGILDRFDSVIAVSLLLSLINSCLVLFE